MEYYDHTQPGSLILRIMAASSLLLGILLLFAPHSVGIIVLGILLLTAWMFSRLNIQVTETELIWSLGPGWIRKSVDLANIESCETMRYPWWYGYGIRLTPQGWLYNVSGKDAVLVRMKTGKTFLLGTDDPRNLKRAMDDAIHRTTAAGTEEP